MPECLPRGCMTAWLLPACIHGCLGCYRWICKCTVKHVIPKVSPWMGGLLDGGDGGSPPGHTPDAAAAVVVVVEVVGVVAVA